MRKAKKWLVLSGILTLFLMGLYIINLVIKTETNYLLPQIPNCPSQQKINLRAALSKISPSNLKEKFPYEAYLSSNNFCNPKSIKQDLLILDSLYPNLAFQNQQLIVETLTKRLEEKKLDKFTTYYPDSLILISYWANQLEGYSGFDETYELVFSAISNYWVNFIANKLGDYSAQDSHIKYSFKFKYLHSVCQSRQFHPSIGNSNDEKIIYYLIDQKYTYLFKRFWDGTGWKFKMLVLLLIIMQLYMVIKTIQYHLKK